jgi:diacylglycerol kinase family enzyme
MVTNTRFIAGFKAVDSEKIKMDDGLLEVSLVKTPKNLKEMNKIIKAVLTRNLNCEFITSFKTEQISLSSNSKIPWTLDGEYGGTVDDVIIKNKRRAIKIIARSKK